MTVLAIGVFAVGLHMATHCGRKAWAKKVMSRSE